MTPEHKRRKFGNRRVSPEKLESGFLGGKCSPKNEARESSLAIQWWRRGTSTAREARVQTLVGVKVSACVELRSWEGRDKGHSFLRWSTKCCNILRIWPTLKYQITLWGGEAGLVRPISTGEAKVHGHKARRKLARSTDLPPVSFLSSMRLSLSKSCLIRKKEGWTSGWEKPRSGFSPCLCPRLQPAASGSSLSSPRGIHLRVDESDDLLSQGPLPVIPA